MDSIDNYQAQTVAKRLYHPNMDQPIVYPALSLAGEVGEFCEKVKKICRDQDGQITPANRQALKLELGDIMWNMAICAQALDLKLSDILQANLDKSADRRRRGQVKGQGDYR